MKRLVMMLMVAAVVLVVSARHVRQVTEPASIFSHHNGVVGPVPGGIAVIALPDEPDVLNSLIRTSSVAGMVLALIQSSLAEMGEDQEWFPVIARAWEIAPDSLSITYHLQPWFWEDGRPLTSEDVRLSCELLRDPRIASPRADLLRSVTRVVALDVDTIRYEFATPQARPVQTTAHSIMPAHHLRDLAMEDAASWPLNRQPVASGPFRLDSWQPGRQLVLSPNPHYAGRPALLQRVVLRIIPDEAARILALEAGEVDLVYDVPAKTAQRLSGVESIEVVEVQGRVFGFVMWNLRHPELRDARVRKALSLAIDRQRFIDDLLGGFATPAASYLPPVLWNHHAGLKPDPYRPDSACALLDQTGWMATGRSAFRMKDGETLRLDIIYRGGDSVRESGAALVRQNLEAVGVRVTLRAMELGAALGFLRAGRFDAYLGEYQANLYADPSPLVMSGATDRFNFGGYANIRVDSLLTAALSEPDPEMSLPLWYAVQEELSIDPPAAVLYYLRQVVAYNKRLRNVRPHMLSPLNNLAEWWIPAEDRRWANPGESR